MNPFSSQPPRIAISACYQELDTFLGHTPMYTIARWYVDSVRWAGGIPHLVVPQAVSEGIEVGLGAALPLDRFDAYTDAAVEHILAPFDGLLLTGGDDIDPAHYGHDRDQATKENDVERDIFELALTKHAVASGLPILAICRGLQILNVALGGSLYQHVPDAIPTAADHDRVDIPFEVAHPVSIAPGSQLEMILGEHQMVNSIHHQAVATLGVGLAAVAWQPESGLIEGIEMPGHTFCVGVQWHPEMLARPGNDYEKLFESFVEAARQHSQAVLVH